MGMQTDDVPMFQSVAELFLTRYHRGTGKPGSDRVRAYRFLLRYGVDPEFRAAVERELGADLDRAEAREELGFVLALELILARNGRWLFEQIISKSRLMEMESTYPEVFTAEQGGSISARELLDLAGGLSAHEREDVALLAKALDDVFPGGAMGADVLNAFRRHASLLAADLGWMKDMEAFQATLARNTDKVLTALGERPEVEQVQAKRLRERGQESEMVFCVASQAVALRWFGSLDTDAAERVLGSAAELGFEETEVLEAISLRRSWSESASEAAAVLMASGEALRQYGKGGTALAVYGWLLGLEGLPERATAELHNRMAVIHREEGRWHDALLEFQEASIVWEALGAKWEEAVTSSLVGEAYARLGKKERGLKYLIQALELMKGVRQEDEKMAKGYFYLAACASCLGRIDLEKAALSAGIKYAERLEDGELLVEFNERLLALPK